LNETFNRLRPLLLCILFAFLAGCLCAGLFFNRQRDVSTIFHEREIRKAEKRFSFLTDSELRYSFQADLSAMIAEIDYKIVAITINKKEKTGQNLLTDNLYELGVKYGLAKIIETIFILI